MIKIEKKNKEDNPVDKVKEVVETIPEALAPSIE